MIKPILFNTDMVRAIMDGRKTVTRRVMKPQPVMDADRMWQWKDCQWMDGGLGFPASGIEDYAPYRPGDILYVRETWAAWSRTMGTQPALYYKADGNAPDGIKWRPSIHMPREAARIFLRVTGVRVGRLQDITVEGILAESVDVEMPPICKQSIDPNFPSDKQRDQWEKLSDAQREEYVANRARHTYIGWCDYADRLFNAFKVLWDSTIRKADRAIYGWEANPWVFVIGFERIDREEA